jgi:hypothetical protein
LIDNYRTLDERIRAVLAACPDVSAKIVGATDIEEEAFVRLFKRSRNWYTHYTPKLKKQAAVGADLLLLTVQLRAIIEMSLLKELGFSDEAIDQSLERVRRYSEIRHFRGLATKIDEVLAEVAAEVDSESR